jgi:hypothetical protein
MTKKHFIAFAKYIKNHRSQYAIAADVLAEKQAFADMIVEIARADNPRFDESSFRAACGL